MSEGQPKDKPKKAPKNSSPPMTRTIPGLALAKWSESWNLIWMGLSCLFEVILIFLVKGGVISLPIVQVVVIGICIPIIVHLLISEVRGFLFTGPSRRK